MAADCNSEERVAEMAAALRHDRREDIVRYLHANGGEASLTELAFRVAAAAEVDFPNAVVTLQDLDLPRLSGCGLVERSGEGTVTLATDCDRVERALARVEEE